MRHKEALLVDAMFEKHLRDLALLRELGLQLKYTVETHAHADHVTGAWLMRQANGCSIVIAESAGAEGADVYLNHGDVLEVGSVKLEVRWSSVRMAMSPLPGVFDRANRRHTLL